jgi:hypothetical protein
MLPLSNSSSLSDDSLSTVLDNDKINSMLTSAKSIYSCTGDEYRQYRRMRNMAIANQQKRNTFENSSRQDLQSSIGSSPNDGPRPSILNFWNTVRLLQLSIRHRRKQDQYTRQINSPESNAQRTTISVGGLQTIDEDENTYHRANIEVADPVLNELTVTVPIVARPTLISLTSTDQEDEQDVAPVTGQTLCKSIFSVEKFFCI